MVCELSGQVEFDYDRDQLLHVRMGAYTTNEDGLLHGHQVQLRSGGARGNEFTATDFELSDGTFKDDDLYQGVNCMFEFERCTARTATQEYMWGESDIAELSALGSLDDEIRRGLIQIDVGVWTGANHFLYVCTAPNLFQSLHDNGPFKHSLLHCQTHRAYSTSDDVRESVWQLQ